MRYMVIHPVDDVWVRVECEEHEARELSDYFSFDIPAAKYMPQFRRRQWAGKIHLFKLRGHLLYRGLVPRLLEFGEQQGYDITNLVPVPRPFLPDTTLDTWLAQLEDLPVVPRDYQRNALRTLLDQHRGIVLSPTGSGKSLIIHLLIQALSVPTLVVVPTTGLVAQMASDFVSYGADKSHIQTIQSGYTKQISAPLVISTWQSIYDLEPTFFAQFKCIVVDEVHLAKAKSLTGLMEKCQTVPYRFGFTGTLDDTQAHRLILEGLFGSVTRVTTTHQLVQNQQLAPLHVKMCVIQYPPADRKQLRRAQYPDEVDFLVSSPARLEIVAQMAASMSGNVLVLFNFVEKHGKPLYKRIVELAPDRDVHFISGEVTAEERERIRVSVESGTHQIIVASYGTTSTGINIPSLNTIIFASPSKSKIRVLQSIGRSLRLHANKTHATLIDFVDDLRTGAYVNHTFKHAEQRVQYYGTERFPFTIKELDADGWILALRKLSGRS